MTSRIVVLLAGLCLCGFATAEAQESGLAIVDIDGRESADGVTITYTARPTRDWEISIPFRLRLPTPPAGPTIWPSCLKASSLSGA